MKDIYCPQGVRKESLVAVDKRSAYVAGRLFLKVCGIDLCIHQLTTRYSGVLALPNHLVHY